MPPALIYDVTELGHGIHRQGKGSNARGERRTGDCLQAAIRIETVNRDVVAHLIRHVDELGGGIDHQRTGKTSRAKWGTVNWRQATVLTDAVTGDIVVGRVYDVGKLAHRVYCDLMGIASDGEG